jgi:hypothetical protein
MGRLGSLIDLTEQRPSHLPPNFRHAKRSRQRLPGAGRIISEHKQARFEVVQYDHGAKELWITLPRSRTYPSFITPADEPTLTLPAENKIPYAWLHVSLSFQSLIFSPPYLVHHTFQLPNNLIGQLGICWGHQTEF